MSDVPYFKPYQEGPIFPDEGDRLAEDAASFLRASDRDVADEVARRNIEDMSEDSFRLFVSTKLKELGIDIPRAY